MFVGAISKTAACGEINAHDSGGFGTVAITKSITITITISADATTAGVLVAGTSGIFIIDGDGLALGSTDGMLLMRRLVGLTGTSATDGAVASLPASRRAWSAARDYLNQTCLAGVL